MHSSDVVIVGAGIIGLSLAMELRRAGASVTVLDRGEPGREASSAAAGMLVTGDPGSHPALAELAKASAVLYPTFVAELELHSAMTVGLENRGAMYIAEKDEELPSAALSQEEIRKLEPALAEQPRVCFLKEQSVDPRLLAQAAVAAAKQIGVVIHHETRVDSVELTKDHHLQVSTSHAPYSTATFVNCAGAWAASIAGAPAPTHPVKGQMLAVIPQQCKLRHVIRSRFVYLVPRKDGRVLIGSTLEDAGFDKSVNPTTIQQLLKAAAHLWPTIEEAKILEAWAGLRPGSPDELPILGPGRLPGTYVATGHFRNGILLAPITATVMSELIQGKSPSVDLRPFISTRFAPGKALAG